MAERIDSTKNPNTLTSTEATIGQLCTIFGLTMKTVKKRIGPVKPSAKRGAQTFYRVKDVAPFLVKPAYNIEEYIRNMEPGELDKYFSKEFWAGMRSRQLFAKEAGDLWPTDKVVAVCGDAFKTISMQVRMLGDSLGAEVELSSRQREILAKHIRSCMNGIHEELINKFKAYPKRDDLAVLNSPGEAQPLPQIEDDDDDDQL